MDDLGFNKVAGAVLATGLGMLLLMKLPGIVMAHSGEEIAYKVGDFGPASGETAEVVDLPFPQQSWVEAMDASKGAKVFKKCKSCHNAEPGGAHSTGPALYGVVGNDVAVKEGFSFSTALTGIEGNWTYEAMDAFLKKPSKYAPGTKMNFVGLKKDADRAAVIEYLRLADPAPEVLPTAKSAEADVMMEKGDTMMTKDETMMEKSDVVMEKTETMMEKSDTVMEKVETIMETSETATDKTETMMKKSDTMVEKVETVMEKTETMKAKTGTMMEKAETVMEKTDTMKEKADTLMEKAETMIEKAE